MPIRALYGNDPQAEDRCCVLLQEYSDEPVLSELIDHIGVYETQGTGKNKNPTPCHLLQVRRVFGHLPRAVPSELHCRHPRGRCRGVCFLRAAGWFGRAVSEGIRRG